MKKTLAIVSFGVWEAFIWGIIVLALFGCTTTKYVPVEKTVEITKEVRDTTIVIQIEQLPGDTVLVPVDPGTDTAESKLENKYCESEAVFQNGHLQHTLTKKPGVKDTIIVPKYIKITEKIKDPQIVEVEKKLTWWQKFRMGAFWWLLILAIVGWRREIISLIKLF